MQMIIKDGIKYDGDVIFHSLSFKEIIKGCIIKYGKKTELEADVFIEASDLFNKENYPPKNYNNIAFLLGHEHPYHIAMLIAFGNGYWWKDGPNISAVIPDDYNNWEEKYCKLHGLNSDYTNV